MIEKIGGEAYALGTAIPALSQTVRVNVEIRDRAAPHVRALADQAGTFREGDRILYIYAVESSRRLIARTAVGDRMPMHLHGCRQGHSRAPARRRSGRTGEGVSFSSAQKAAAHRALLDAGIRPEQMLPAVMTSSVQQAADELRDAAAWDVRRS